MELNRAIADDLAHAKHDHTEALKKLIEPKNRLTSLQSKLQNLENERSKIIKERASGNSNTEQESRLVIIAADLEGIKPLISEVTTEIESLNPDKFLQNLQRAEESWRKHQVDVKIGTLSERALEIETMLMQVVQMIGSTAGSGSTIRWKPSTILTRFVQTGYISKTNNL